MLQSFDICFCNNWQTLEAPKTNKIISLSLLKVNNLFESVQNCQFRMPIDIVNSGSNAWGGREGAGGRWRLGLSHEFILQRLHFIQKPFKPQPSPRVFEISKNDKFLLMFKPKHSATYMLIWLFHAFSKILMPKCNIMKYAP